MRIFLTGGTGFIGSHFVKIALQEGHEVHALRRSESSPRIPLDPEPNWIEGDLSCDPGEVLGECDAFVHLAAKGVTPQKATWEEIFRWNVLESVKLWNLAADRGVKQFVICGSCTEYGRSAERYSKIPASAPLEPVSGYGAAKAAASLAALAMSVERQIPVTVLRPFIVYGTGQHPANFLPSLMEAALAGQDFEMTPGEQIRDFHRVEDCAEDFLKALITQTPDPISIVRNLGSGREMSLRDFARARWTELSAQGSLKIGAIPYRPNEVMRFVPEL